jgi:galactokinase
MMRPAAEWLQAVEGAESDRTLLVELVTAFSGQFGDVPLRVFRAPGRINLRGMHVDTHGGWLNLMTHHREVCIAAAPAPAGRCTISSLTQQGAPSIFDVETEWERFQVLGGTWMERVHHPSHEDWLGSRRGRWENYCIGAALRARQVVGGPLRSVQAVVASDLPEGASLSSSAALCVALLQAMLALNDVALAPDALVVAARDAEWFTGARTGTGDQAAVVLGRAGHVLHLAPPLKGFSSAGAQWLRFPEALRVLVVHSHARRNLSGEALLSYTRTRFAYSLALEVFGHLLPQQVQTPLALSHLTPAALGGPAAALDLLQSLPEEMTLAEVRQLGAPEVVHAAARKYFAGASENAWPQSVHIRGPLTYALAESERARLFFDALQSGDYERAGALMYIGHDGDRIAGAACASGAVSLAETPGAFGASTPALDALVDCARKLGALGASLTGAGLGGAIVVLCLTEQCDAIASGLRRCISSAHYAAVAGLPAPLTPAQVLRAVEVNVAPPAAGELVNFLG